MFLSGYLFQLGHHAIEDSPAEFGTRDLASAEEEAYFDLVALVEEFLGHVELHLQIVLSNFESQAHLLHLNLLLMLAALGELFGLLVAIFAPIEDFHYRWLGIGGNFCQVQARFRGGIQSLSEANNTLLRTITTHQTDGLGGYLMIQTDFVYLEVSLKSSSVL